YTSCIKQLWATTKVKIVNREEHIQALVEKKKMIITQTSVRSDLHLEDVKDEHVTTTFNDPLSGEDRLKLTKLMELYTKLQLRVLALETTKANQALEIESLKRRVKNLEKKASKKTHKLKMLYKIGSSTRVKSSEDAGLGDQEDASKQRRMIEDLDVDEGVALVDETQGRNDQDMFDTSIFDDEEVVAKEVVIGNEVNTVDPVLTASEVVTTVGVETSKPKANGIVIQEHSETPTPTPKDSSQQSSKAKDKGKAKMIEHEKPLKRKDRIMTDEEDNTQAMIDVDCELAARLQEEEKGELTIEEKSWIRGSEKAEEGSSKRAADKLEQEDAKRQRIKEEKEFAKLKRCLEIIPEDDDDSIVKSRFKKTKPVDDMDNLLFQTLKIMFEHHVEENTWKYQQGKANVLNWKLFDSCGVYCVTTHNMVYYLLVEKMYPFTRNILHQMWNDVRLWVDYEDSLDYQDTANSGGKKETKAMVFHTMDTEEVSDRFVAPCFINGLEAYDGEISLGVEENLISNDYAVKLCLEHEVCGSQI
nr:hypothetical protein [Tanacetum cinerariifolium]